MMQMVSPVSKMYSYVRGDLYISIANTGKLVLFFRGVGKNKENIISYNKCDRENK